MANENALSIKVTPDDITKIIEGLEILNNTLPQYLISLTPEKRKVMPKMSDKTTPFVEKVLDYAKSNPEFGLRIFTLKN